MMEGDSLVIDIKLNIFQGRNYMLIRGFSFDDTIEYKIKFSYNLSKDYLYLTEV